MVQFGLFFWGLDQGARPLRSCADVIARLPRDVNVVIGGAATRRPRRSSRSSTSCSPATRCCVVGFGAAGASTPRSSTRSAGSCPPLFEFVTPMPYVELQQMLDEANGWGHPLLREAAATSTSSPTT